jgi:hypothetical protein
MRLRITGIYPVPVLLDERLLRRDDREAYVELNRAGPAATAAPAPILN